MLPRLGTPTPTAGLATDEEIIEESELGTSPPRSPRSHRSRLPDLLAVGGGGAVGACLRYAETVWVEGRVTGQFPWATFAINMAGCLILGLFLTLAIERFPGRTLPRLFVATGILGGYTTFSTFCYETVRLVQHDHAAVAGTYVVLSLVFGVMATAVGIRVARLAAPR